MENRMAAELLVTPSRAADPNNSPYSGATWAFYVSGTTTPLAVYADAALTTSLGATVTADSGGKFPAIYFDSTKTYRGVCKNASGSVTLHDFDPINTGVLSSLGLATGASLIGFNEGSAGATDTDLESLLRAGWAFPEMFRQTGAVDDTSMLQALFASGRKLIAIPEGDYTLGASITLPPGTQILNSGGANFYAAANNLKMFTTTVLTAGTRWIGGWGQANGYTGVNMFDLRNFRAGGASIQAIGATGFNVAIYLRELCWDTTIRDVYLESSVDAIVLGEGCNAVTIDHPGINVFSSTGITVLPGTGPLPNVGNNIMGGFVQDGPVGVLDQGRSTSINGTYFENCDDADISLAGAIMPIVQRSYHSSPLGTVCVKARNTEGADLKNVTLHGDRDDGLFDFDNTNTYCRASIARTASLNTNTGVITGLKLDDSLTGTLIAGDTGFNESTLRPYVVTGPDSGSLIQRSYANGFDDIASGLGTAVNCLRSEGCGYQLVVGGETFTFTNLANGQTFTMFLKFLDQGGGYSAITVAGTTLDATAVADGMRKVVKVTKVSADADHIWIDESPWK